MATSSSILPHSIRHWYLRAARARLRRDVSPPFLGLLARQPDLMELVRNIDHRLAQTPFHETHRTFAQVDYTIGLFLPSGEFAALRGWVVDLDDYVATIRFPDVASADQFVHLGDARPDVARHLPAERTSGSGFVALVPLAAVRSRHRITLSYTVRSGSSHTFSMPLPPLVFGVRHPPVPEREPPVAGNAAGILLTAVNDAQSVDIAARIEAGLSAFDS